MGTPVKFVHGDTRRACASCATAKTRCVTSNTTPGISSSCDRCLLLKKTCTSRPENANRRKRKTGHAALAEKVDEIVALLKVPSSVQETPGQATHHQTVIPERLAQAAAHPPSLSFPSLIDSHGLTISIEEADDLLSHVRQHQASLAPYVEIAATVTASRLRDEATLLFLAVTTAVASARLSPMPPKCLTFEACGSSSENTLSSSTETAIVARPLRPPGHQEQALRRILK